MASDTRNPVKKDGTLREKVRIQPGFHMADWVRMLSMNAFKFSDSDVPPKQRRISRKELALHNKPDDCWMSYEGKVYNVTHYFPYHPGGIPKLMLCAGQDCKELFDKYHRWVNIDNLIGKCLVGYLDPSLDLDPVLEEEEVAEAGDASGVSQSNNNSSSHNRSSSNSSSSSSSSIDTNIGKLLKEADSVFESFTKIEVTSSDHILETDEQIRSKALSALSMEEND